MDPRKFLAPIQCTLCDLLLYTLRDVSEHCSRHDVINLLCHHCLTNFDTKGAIAAHMNQKGAHLRQSFDMTTYTSAMPSPAPCTTAVLPLSQSAPQPTPTLSGSSPTPTVAISDNVSLDQLLRDIDAPNTGTDTSAFSAGVLPQFQPQAASTQQHLFVSPDVSPTVGARPRSSVSYPPGEYRQLRQQNTEYKFLLWWCLHHLKSLHAPPPSAGGEFFYFVVWMLPISELLEPPCRHLCRMIFLLFTRRYYFNIFHNQ